MGFEGLLGNERLKENLRMSVGRGRISHFYLISGPAGSGKHTLAKLLAGALMCESERRPCGSCTACRKIMAGTHPDFITVEDPDHKRIPVDMVRRIREDMFILPNESDHKIYLFPQELGIEGQNALLKILEEPPAHLLFILTCDARTSLLETIRSRCVCLTVAPTTWEEAQPILTARLPGEDPAELQRASCRREATASSSVINLAN